MAKNQNLHKAKSEKNDEFYTQIKDIENELGNYRKHFKGKTVLCNCDDPLESKFWEYFTLNFERLGLKKLIATCYKNQDVNLFSKGKSEKAAYLIYEGDKNGDRVLNPEEIGIKYFKGDGDFKSDECIKLLKEADIICTNPPFSLFREYVAQLVGNKKKFIIIGNKNAITYKEIFKLIKDNKIWLGVTSPKEFLQPDGEIKKFGNIGWFTNLSHNKRNEELILYKEYTKKDYPKYDNYDAIEVSKVKDIPLNYKGVMGVPITFLDKWNPSQFEITGMAEDNGKGFSGGIWDGKNPHCVINGENKFKRIFIKNNKL